MKSIIRLGLLLVVGILLYNLFLGSPEEQAQSREIFGKVKELAKSSIDLLKSEKDKYDEGKYDGALDRIGNVFGKLKKNAEEIQDSELLDRLAELEDKRKALEQHLQESEVQEYDDQAAENRDKEEIQKEWESLIQETEDLMKKMEK